MSPRAKTPPADDVPSPELAIPQRMVDPDQLTPHPRNAKLHDKATLQGSVAKLNQFQSITVNLGTKTGRPMEILSGHGTVDAWKVKHPGKPIQVGLVDYNDEDALRVVLNGNPGPRDPGYDPRLLAELLGDLPDFDGTGYEPGDLDDLLAELDQEPIVIVPGDDVDEATGVGGKSRDDWEGKARRVMVLDYPVTQFVWLQRHLKELADERDLSSNAAVIISLVAATTDDTPPAGDSE